MLSVCYIYIYLMSRLKEYWDVKIKKLFLFTGKSYETHYDRFIRRENIEMRST